MGIEGGADDESAQKERHSVIRGSTAMCTRILRKEMMDKSELPRVPRLINEEDI